MHGTKNNRDTAGNLGGIPSGLNLLAGIWVTVSPWILGFDGSATLTWSTCVTGAAIILLSAIRLGYAGTQWLSWINCVLGAWLIVSPFVLAYHQYATVYPRATWNGVILGIVVIFLGLWAALSTMATPNTAATRPNRPLSR